MCLLPAARDESRRVPFTCFSFFSLSLSFFLSFSFRVHATRTIMDLLEHSRFNDSDLQQVARPCIYMQGS